MLFEGNEEKNLIILSQQKENSLNPSGIAEGSSRRRSVSRLDLDRFSIVTKPPTKSLGGWRLVVCSPVTNKVLQRHLVWYTLYRGITVLQWYTLLRSLERSIQSGRPADSCISLYGVILLSSNSREGLQDWSSHTRPIYKDLRKRAYCPNVQIDMEEVFPLLDYVVSEIGVPRKPMPMKELLSWNRVYIPPYSPPPPERYVGVGYKDRGTLSTVQRDEPLPFEDYSPSHSEELSYLFELWKNFLKFSTKSLE